MIFRTGGSKQQRGRKAIIYLVFPEHCIEMKENELRRGCPTPTPPHPTPNPPKETMFSCQRPHSRTVSVRIHKRPINSTFNFNPQFIFCKEMFLLKIQTKNCKIVSYTLEMFRIVMVESLLV